MGMESFSMDIMMTLLLAIGLSAACGLRLFIPPLMLSAASLYFHFPLPTELDWMGTYPAFLTLLCAVAVEVGAYYIPWLDHFLDMIAAPLAVVAGTLLTGSLTGEMNPVLKWSIALIAGGGAAGTVQTLTAATRLTSLGTTLGLANPIIATAESFMAIIVSLFTIWLPVAGLVLTAVIVFVITKLSLKFLKKKPAEIAATVE
jgi:hypothetical protein